MTPSIDFEIIWKKTHGDLSREEARLFEAWIIEDRKHLEYYNKVERFYREGSGFDKNPFAAEASWKKVVGRIGLLKKRRKQRRIALFASATASVIILITIFLFIPQKDPAELVNTPHVIEPGTDKALLILDDGSTFDLSSEKELSIQSGGTTIQSKGSSIEYLQQEPGPALLKYNTLTVPRGGEFFLTLSDGTRVWLNSGTTLHYPVRFVTSERMAELDGEAYFEVATDEKKPFRIYSGDQVVEVLGTSFNISSYSDDEQISTTLVSGKVNVFLKSDPTVSQILMPSYQSVYHKTNRSFTRKKVNVDASIAWKTGWFRFEDQELSEMMKTLSRWYDVNVTFENREAMDLHFTGSIRRYENFEKILEIIERTEEVEFEIADNHIVIK